MSSRMNCLSVLTAVVSLCACANPGNFGEEEASVPQLAQVASEGDGLLGESTRALVAPPDTIRIHALLTSNTDGAQAPTVTAAQIRDAVTRLNQILQPANIVFEFDPETDIERLNNTLINHDCTLAPDANMNLPPDQEPACDYTLNIGERNRYAQKYPGKLVVHFGTGDRPLYDNNLKRWVYGPRDYQWSNGTDSFVAMQSLWGPGDGLAHEVGHYLWLQHTFGPSPATIAQAQAAIRNYVEGGGHSKDEGMYAFEGDGISDTPPDPGPALFSASGLDPCDATDGTLSLPVRFADGLVRTYHFQPDRENIMNYWDKTCRGSRPRISAGQAARIRQALAGNRYHLIAPKVLYTGVWETGDTGQTRALGWAVADFATRFNQEIANGRHLVHMQAYDIGGGQIRYDGVWELGSRGTTRALGWAVADFATRFNQEIASGRHLVHMQAYDLGGGQIRYDGAWEIGSRGTTRALGWAVADFATRFNQEIASGRHLVHMQAYDIGGGQIRYDGVWETGDTGQTRALGWAVADFATRFNQEIASGRHLVHMQAYDISGGQIRYDGVWELGNRNTTRALAWAFNDLSMRMEQETASGRRLTHMQAYDLGGGQIRWDAVWEGGPNGQTRSLGTTLYPFATRFNDELAKGRHLVLMKANTVPRSSGGTL